MSILNKIIEAKKAEVAGTKKAMPPAGFAGSLPKSTRSFRKALSAKKGRPALVAEIKRASPSRGIMRKELDIASIAQLYDKYADAISVLTDEKFFMGKKEDLAIAAAASSLPILRKDFIIDNYQIYESRLYGADAILLIASILPEKKLAEFIKAAKGLGMDCLVEADSAAAMRRALAAGAEIIGINNRNLHTLKIDSNKTRKLLKHIPPEKRKKIVVVSESGIESRPDIEKFGERIDAVLVGSALMQSGNIESKLRELTFRPLVKICGITNRTDAANALKLGADFLGFNFYRGSPRYLKPEKAAGIIKSLPKNFYAVGVFVNARRNEINSTAKKCRLDFIQLSGDEEPASLRWLRKPVIKAVRLRNSASIREIKRFPTPFILLDSFREGLYGGTGKQFKYSLLRRLPRGKLYFAAGGINPANVSRLLRKAGLFAIDVCSGVESAEGKKSLRKMEKLFREVDCYENKRFA